MAFTLDNIIQQATGTFEGNTGTVTLPTGTEAGNAVVIICGLIGTNVELDLATINTPAGFSGNGGGQGTIAPAKGFYFIKPSAGAGETSWTLSLTAGESRLVFWTVFEIPGADWDWPDKAYLVSASSSGTGVTESTETVSTLNQSESYEAVVFAAFIAAGTDSTQPDVTNYDNLFYEVARVSGNDALRGATMTVVAKASQTVEIIDCTADITPAAYVGSVSMVLTGLNSYHASNVAACFGAEIGTVSGLTASDPGEAVPGPWDSSVGTPAVVTSTPRTGNYSLELSSVAAAEWVAWTRKTAPAAGTLGTDPTTALPAIWVDRFHVLFPGSLPLADVVLASLEVGSLTNGLQLRYIAASQKLGLQIGSGTEVISDATVTADTWIGIDRRYDPRTTTHTCDWAVCYDANPADPEPFWIQTQAATVGMTSGGISVVRFGWTGLSTATVRYDDIVTAGPVSAGVRHAYPLGDVRVHPLKVDPAGTLVVTGSAANFKVFTSNGGTLSTFDSAASRAALDDIPPVIGSTADGLAQVSVAASDYVLVPYETLTCAPELAPLGGRHYWAGWAASGNPASIRVQMGDETGLLSVPAGSVDPGYDNANLVWGTKLHRLAANAVYRFTQARVDALAIALGFSEDANPDAGIHAVLFELVVVKGVNWGTVGGEFRLYTRQHPHSGAILGLEVATPAGTRGATLTWTAGGTPMTHYVGPNTTYVEPIGALEISDIPSVGLIPDPT